MTTLKEAIEAIESIRIRIIPHKKSIADELLGKYKGIIPQNKTSGEYLRELRDTLYGKVRPS